MTLKKKSLTHATTMALAIVTSFLSIQAVAADACSNAYTQADLNECTADILKIEDRKLNTSYASLRRFLDAGEKEQLKQTQLAWIDFRDKACEFSSRNLKGGSAYQMEHNSCLTNYSKQRRLELEAEIESVQ